jgi:tRNA(fMet)-specific endonuclease VapC
MPDSKRRRAIEAYLQEEVKVKLPILPYTQEAAEWFAKERELNNFHKFVGWASRPSFLDGRDAHPTKTIKIVSYLIRDPKERARLIPSGLTPSYADGQIAAIAKVNNLILVTRNVADYANFQDLAIENWFS